MNPQKILLVDDDKDFLYGMKIWLRANGYQVCFATDTASVIAVAQAEKPNLILLDIGLPGGDGYLAMARLRALIPLAHIPIIVITAKDAFGHRDKALQAGAEAFFQKPVEQKQLLAAIQKALGEESKKKDLESIHQGKILVIDDDQDLLHAMRVRLKSYGFDTYFAMDAIQGVSLALKTKPDIILLDIGLPGGDGYVAMSRLKSLMPLAHVPVIIITARDASTHQEKALAAGADAFFQKPIDNQKLLAAIQKALGKAGS